MEADTSIPASMLKEAPQARPNIYQALKEACAMQGRDVPIKDVCTVTQMLPRPLLRGCCRSMLADHHQSLKMLLGKLPPYLRSLLELCFRRRHSMRQLYLTLHPCEGAGCLPPVLSLWQLQSRAHRRCGLTTGTLLLRLTRHTLLRGSKSCRISFRRLISSLYYTRKGPNSISNIQAPRWPRTSKQTMASPCPRTNLQKHPSTTDKPQMLAVDVMYRRLRRRGRLDCRPSRAHQSLPGLLR